jgi:hypothetical protein
MAFAVGLDWIGCKQVCADLGSRAVEQLERVPPSISKFCTTGSTQ